MTVVINGSSGISGVAGTSGSPALRGDDTNTGISFDTDIIIASTGGVERARVDSAGRLLVGVTSSRAVSSVNSNIQLEGTTYDSSCLSLVRNSATDALDAGGLLFGRSRGSGTTIVSNNDRLGFIGFYGANGSNLNTVAAVIEGFIDNTPGASNDMPGRLVFSTTADGAAAPTERMRIASAANTTVILVGRNSTDTGAINFVNSSQTQGWAIGTNSTNFYIFDADASNYAFLAQNPTAWSFASDVRLKENITDLDYGIDTIKQIRARRFNFIGDDEPIIGFIAQEIKAVVPEAVSGEEIPFDDADTPQERAQKTLGVGKETLIPILVKALQEAITRIEQLESRITTLESQS